MLQDVPLGKTKAEEFFKESSWNPPCTFLWGQWNSFFPRMSMSCLSKQWESPEKEGTEYVGT